MRFSWIAAGALAAQVDLVRAAPTSHSHETTRAGKVSTASKTSIECAKRLLILSE